MDCLTRCLVLWFLFGLWVYCYYLLYFLWGDLRATQLCFSFTVHHVEVLLLFSFPWDAFWFTSLHLSPWIKTWNVTFTSSFWFHPFVLCFLGCLLLFLCVFKGAYQYVHHQLTMLEKGFWMQLKLETQIWKKIAGSVTLMWLLFHGKSELAPVEHGLPENGKYMA